MAANEGFVMQSKDTMLEELKIRSAMKYRKIHLAEEVTRDEIFKIMYLLDRLIENDKESGTKEPITLCFSTYGGYCYDGYTLCSKIEEMVDMGYEIIGDLTGYIMSMGVPIFISTSKRIVSRYATAMIHQVSSGNYGTLQEQQENIQETNRLWEMYKKLIVSKTKITDAQMEEMKKCKLDWYLSAEDCVKYGLCDYIK